jgi:hypothetical protein
MGARIKCGLCGEYASSWGEQRMHEKDVHGLGVKENGGGE